MHGLKQLSIQLAILCQYSDISKKGLKHNCMCKEKEHNSLNHNVLVKWTYMYVIHGKGFSFIMSYVIVADKNVTHANNYYITHILFLSLQKS